jgi:hypothetical protein
VKSIMVAVGCFLLGIVATLAGEHQFSRTVFAQTGFERAFIPAVPPLKAAIPVVSPLDPTISLDHNSVTWLD